MRNTRGFLHRTTIEDLESWENLFHSELVAAWAKACARPQSEINYSTVELRIMCAGHYGKRNQSCGAEREAKQKKASPSPKLEERGQGRAGNAKGK